MEIGIGGSAAEDEALVWMDGLVGETELDGVGGWRDGGVGERLVLGLQRREGRLAVSFCFVRELWGWEMI